MRACAQRVAWARVEVGGEVVGEIGAGLLVLLGVARGDDEAACDWLWHKLFGLRVFPDADGRTNLSLADVGGSVLVVSQFTLVADVRHGMRPSFGTAAPPDEARRLYLRFLDLARHDVGEGRLAHGRFGADMQVTLQNDGPFTVVVDTP